MIKNTQKIYKEIIKQIDLLNQVIGENKNLEKLKKASNYLKNDEEWLLIINHWLKDLNKKVNEIKINKINNFWNIIENILKSVKYED